MMLPECYRCKSQPCRCKDGITLYHGDCREVLPHLANIDGCLTDPPYGLEFMGQDWDHGIPGAHFWELIGAALKPGAPLLAFGGTRTYHRLLCAIEDAGFEIRDCLMWLYASGFPKSHDISKAIDKAAGAEREVVGRSKDSAQRQQTTFQAQENKSGYTAHPEGNRDITAPATEAAKVWDGWGTALSPSFEPVALAMKPLDGTFAQNALEHGVAGLAIDNARISTTDVLSGSGTPPLQFGGNNARPFHEMAEPRGCNQNPSGRWPKNVILSHHPDCVCAGTRKVKGGSGWSKTGSKESSNVAMSGKNYSRDPKPDAFASPDGTETVEKWECVEGCPIKMLDEQSIAGGIHGAGHAKDNDCRTAKGSWFAAEESASAHNGMRYGDTGGASRFYFVAKASTGDREEGLIERLPCLVCGDTHSEVHVTETRGGEMIIHKVSDIDIFTIPTLSVIKANSKRKNYPWRIAGCRRNNHPTVKPTELMQGLLAYLLTLIATPTGGVVVDPFCGSGSTLIAAKRLGRRAVGIEINAEYCDIAVQRLDPQTWGKYD